MHCNQPPTVDTATGGTTGLAPGAEAGMQIGWDDEQVTVWLDRSVGLLRDRANNTATNPESPLGVLGYRVDVREASATTWNPLCAVSGSLPFSGANASGDRQHAERRAVRQPGADPLAGAERRRPIRPGCRCTSRPGAARAW